MSERIRSSERRRRYIIGASGTAVGILVGAVVGTSLRNSHDAHANQRTIESYDDHTATELRFADALRASQGVDDVQVECIPEMPKGKFGRARTLQIGKATLHIAEVKRTVCQDAAAVIGRHELFPAGPELDDAAFALSVLTHEGRHFANPPANEGEIQCEAIQRAPMVARNLGASVEVAQQLGTRIAQASSAWLGGEYVPPSTCYDEGPLDLDKNSPGFFPWKSPYPVEQPAG